MTDAASPPHSPRASRWRSVPWVFMSFAAQGAWAQNHDHGALPEHRRDAGASLYAQDDLVFLSHMIVHHQQALDMAALVPSRSPREDFVRFARYVDGAQRAEIEQMNSLLRVAAARGMVIPHHDMQGDPPMTGMLSKAQMAALATASGPAFEKLWLQGMIYHHEGALAMGLEQQQRQFETGRQPYGIDVLVDDIVVGQRAEITRMRAWLVQWALSASVGTG